MQSRSDNRTSRVVMMYRPENLDNAVREFTEVLGITDLEGPYTMEQFGVRVYISWSEGLEFSAPYGTSKHSEALWKVLNTRGEGPSHFVYKVTDLDVAEKRAESKSRPRLGDRIDARELSHIWRERFDVCLESILTPIAGVPVTLIEIEEADRNA